MGSLSPIQPATSYFINGKMKILKYLLPLLLLSVTASQAFSFQGLFSSEEAADEEFADDIEDNEEEAEEEDMEDESLEDEDELDNEEEELEALEDDDDMDD